MAMDVLQSPLELQTLVWYKHMRWVAGGIFKGFAWKQLNDTKQYKRSLSDKHFNSSEGKPFYDNNI